MKKRPLVIATSNRGKLAELRELLSALPVEVLGMQEALGEPLDIAEEGETFEANAIHKATVVANAAGMLTLADDSGLEVDALGGEPGVHSARFAGPDATDAKNNAKLLAALRGLAGEAKTARFRCVLALVEPGKAAPLAVVEGRCEGVIAEEARGEGGFGYDPLFIVAETGRTMAELSAAEKNRLSHRARALEAMLPKLRAVLER